MCGVSVVLVGALGALYLTSVLAAVLVALLSADRERRADARKVLQLLLSALPGFPRPTGGLPFRIEADTEVCEHDWLTSRHSGEDGKTIFQVFRQNAGHGAAPQLDHPGRQRSTAGAGVL